MSADPRQTEPRNGAALKTALGFGVHIFTATGAALGLLALLAAGRADWPLVFLLPGIALVVHGRDGTVARRLDVAARLPRWSGEALDLVVDFITYVLVPSSALL